ncbi:MAG: hypothetical protein LBT41_06245 [Candidatus Methanoplasma sp.]|jgi:hypothetical protein|nr:hypothetical protein [Candidatus Methanoplasma sp.]
MTDGLLGDLEKTAVLQELFKTPHDLRDGGWTDEFLSNVVDASFRDNPERQVITGPDGMPYFVLLTPEPGVPFSCFVIRHMMPQFLLEEGWGVVINPATPNPDWVFKYGDLLNLELHGQFYKTDELWAPKVESVEKLKASENVLMGMPDGSILPEFAFALLKRILSDFGLPPRIALMVRAGKMSLAFPYTPDMFEDPSHFQRLMQIIDWIMPSQYCVLYMSDNEGFHDM